MTATLEAPADERERTDDEPAEPGEHDEPAEPGTDEPDTDEPDPERERVQAMEPTREQLRELDVENERHEQAVHEIMGEFVAGFGACEACAGSGMVPPGPEPQAHPWYKACATCEGFGQVLTGSLREPNNAVDCPQCAGRGYLEAVDSAGTPLAELAKQRGGNTAPIVAPVADLPAVDGASPPAAELEPAGFGTPAWMGNPNIGNG
jgi:hypothetical protein